MSPAKFTPTSPYMCVLLAASLAGGCSDPPAAPTAALTLLPASTTFPTGTPDLTPALETNIGPAIPSPLPLPSPTPWNHTVREGDTLLGIALRYGIKLEALLATNPGINAQLIRIGQQVQLPVNANETRTSGGTDEPSANVAIDPPVCYPSPGGRTFCIAVVHNNDTEPLTNIQLTFDALTAASTPDVSQTTTLQVELLWPGETAAAHAWFAAGSAAGGARATLRTATAASGLAASFARVTTSDATFNSAGGAATVRGAVASQANLPLLPVHIMVLLYNSQDIICSYSISLLPTVLEPQSSAPFETAFGAVPCLVDRVETLAWGQIAAATPSN